MKIIAEKQMSTGNMLVLRYPELTDAQAMCEYINTLSQEKTFVRFQGEEMSLEDEEKYLEALLEKINNQTAVVILAFVGDTLVGISDVVLKEKTESHEGVLGISISQPYRGQGVGSFLLEQLLSEAKKALPMLRLVTLSVFATNSLALHLYQKYGFKEYGRLPNGIKHKNVFVDHVYMYRDVRQVSESLLQ